MIEMEDTPFNHIKYNFYVKWQFLRKRKFFDRKGRFTANDSEVRVYDYAKVNRNWSEK